jgi:hypothetical protein
MRGGFVLILLLADLLSSRIDGIELREAAATLSLPGRCQVASNAEILHYLSVRAAAWRFYCEHLVVEQRLPALASQLVQQYLCGEP